MIYTSLLTRVIVIVSEAVSKSYRRQLAFYSPSFHDFFHVFIHFGTNKCEEKSIIFRSYRNSKYIYMCWLESLRLKCDLNPVSWKMVCVSWPLKYYLFYELFPIQ